MRSNDLFPYQRMRKLNTSQPKKGPIIYWMSRDQRVHDNWALLYAQSLAIEQKQPLAVVFCLVPTFLGATLRQYDFMIKGLLEVEQTLKKLSIPFYLLTGDPVEQIEKYCKKYQIETVITDFSPLKINKKWKIEAAAKLSAQLFEVDAHNIVPCWLASPKQEYAARTFRPKIQRLLTEYLIEFPEMKKHPLEWKTNTPAIKWHSLYSLLNVNTHVKRVDWIIPGANAAHKQLETFIDKKVAMYDDERNDPTIDAQSNLSPYLHFGQISAQRIALKVLQKVGRSKGAQAFLEELIIRRELSDNFCFYNDTYDSIKGFPAWAQSTLTKHLKDKREHIYSLSEFDSAQTHDALWNAAQKEMVIRGKMHGFMRMYWAKKILEWSSSPEEALKIAIYLNDAYELDGRDPNGYVGIAWSLGGVHDRAWAERKVFGKIRYMSYQGCKSKFDVEGYIKKVKSL